MIGDGCLCSGLIFGICLFFSCFLQGSVAIAGAVVRWLKDNMGMVQSSSEIGTCTSSLITFRTRRWGLCLNITSASVSCCPLFQRNWQRQQERRTAVTSCQLFRGSTPPTGSPAQEGERVGPGSF